MFNLVNKKILIMGATGYIGKQVALTLDNLGAKLILSGKNEDILNEILCELKGSGHYILPFDVKNIDDISNFMKEIVAVDGNKLFGLVYCTGIFPIRPLKNTKIDFLHNLMLINFYSFIEIIRCFSDKRICNEKASIVSLSSIASIDGEKGQLAYSASKGAMDSSIKVLAKELSSKNIKINSIRPAALLPENIPFDNLPEAIQNTINQMQTGPISNKSIATQIAFLLSEYSNNITGQCFDVRGCLI